VLDEVGASVCLCIGAQKRMVPKRSSDLTFFKRSRRALSSRSACARSLGVKLLRLAILASTSSGSCREYDKLVDNECTKPTTGPNAHLEYSS